MVRLVLTMIMNCISVLGFSNETEISNNGMSPLECNNICIAIFEDIPNYQNSKFELSDTNLKFESK